MKNAVFWEVTPCGSYKNRCFGGLYSLHYQSEKIGKLGTTLAVTSNRSTLRRYTRNAFVTTKLACLSTSHFIPLAWPDTFNGTRIVLFFFMVTDFKNDLHFLRSTSILEYQVLTAVAVF
jgi:hypothetical protein